MNYTSTAALESRKPRSCTASIILQRSGADFVRLSKIVLQPETALTPPSLSALRDRAAALAIDFKAHLASSTASATSRAPNLGDLSSRLQIAELAAELAPERWRVLLPDSVHPLLQREIVRILAALDCPTSAVDLSDDRWKKNRRILTGKLIPVGAEFAAPASGIPRRTLLTGGLTQGFKLLQTLVSTGGFRPLFELHAHPDSLDHFNPDGWRATYHRLAELLLLNPEYRGVMASSWFRDPALKAISPKLSYLRDYPERHGASMFLAGVDTEGSSGALARSPTRQRMFCEGTYVPRIYMMIWPRQALLHWHHHDH